jgi:hypothetical protein
MATKKSLCRCSALWFQDYDEVVEAHCFGGRLIVLKAFEENSGALVSWADIKHDYMLHLTTCLWWRLSASKLWSTAATAWLRARSKITRSLFL